MERLAVFIDLVIHRHFAGQILFPETLTAAASS